jgi:5-methylcytosine-specific restriction endonuclease McrA
MTDSNNQYKREKNSRTKARKIFWNDCNRDSYRCPDCESQSDYYEVHHVDGNHDNNSLNNLVALCYSCHVGRHRRENIEKRLDDMRTEFESIVSA